jgi:hypothetical protein
MGFEFAGRSRASSTREGRAPGDLLRVEGHAAISPAPAASSAPFSRRTCHLRLQGSGQSAAPRRADSDSHLRLP